VILSILAEIGRWQIQMGESAQGIDLLTQVNAHPAANGETREVVQKLLAGLGSPPSTASTRDLWALVEDVLRDM
jgi:hypothetical protein